MFWGTDFVFYGSPQWQIEALRRLEIPEDMQKKHGFAPLGAADGSVKSAIFGFNGARHYHLDLHAASNEMPFDGIAKQKAAYLENGGSLQQRRLWLRGEGRLINTPSGSGSLCLYCTLILRNDLPHLLPLPHRTFRRVPKVVACLPTSAPPYWPMYAVSEADAAVIVRSTI